MVRKLRSETEVMSEEGKTLFWDIDDLVRETRYSKTWLEENLLRDPRIRRYQRQPYERGKRIWLREPTEKAIKEIIMNEWL
ncbi:MULTISPECIES: hypothetical protein [Ureibacillus]|uniref:Phage pi2 protein 07 n=1 Tax=Ureibacillus thermosphaericus TaxID=51173 RepID=A0A840PQ48_URETH|nr:hypothetical protein [Ureibacillus thermosphaericus]MBB5148619.1 phage pi2 protein 07 [Ureibacillus thermosphaericus]NKZ31336.1 hypothetical protein [Ureibacillus thermosphaericus]